MADLTKKESAQTITDSYTVQNHNNLQYQRTQDKNVYKLLSLYDMLEMKIPARQWIAYPFIQEKSVCMLYAPRGIGKTHVAMTLALGIASGTSVMNFEIKEPHRVVYIDGEMAAYDFIERTKNFCFGLGITNPQTFINLHVLSNDIQPKPLPNIGIPKGQNAIMPLLDQAEVIIIDNISALCYFGKENEAESWIYMQQWLINLKRLGKTMLIIDHSGKIGENNRGTSKKQDIMESVVALTKPDDYKITDGARFVMSFTKTRNVCNQDVSPREFRLISEPENRFLWSESAPSIKKSDRETEIAQAYELKSQGLSAKEIASAMQIGRTKTYELLKCAGPNKPRENNLEDLDKFS